MWVLSNNLFPMQSCRLILLTYLWYHHWTPILDQSDLKQLSTLKFKSTRHLDKRVNRVKKTHYKTVHTWEKLVIHLFDIQRTKNAMDKKSTGKTTPKIEDRWSGVVCGKSLGRLALDAKRKYTWNLNSLSTIHYVKNRISDFFCKEVLVKRGPHALTVTWEPETTILAEPSLFIITICLIFVSHRVTQNGVNEIYNFGRPSHSSSLLYTHVCLIYAQH